MVNCSTCCEELARKGLALLNILKQIGNRKRFCLFANNFNAMNTINPSNRDMR